MILWPTSLPLPKLLFLLGIFSNNSYVSLLYPSSSSHRQFPVCCLHSYAWAAGAFHVTSIEQLLSPFNNNCPFSCKFPYSSVNLKARTILFSGLHAQYVAEYPNKTDSLWAFITWINSIYYLIKNLLNNIHCNLQFLLKKWPRYPYNDAYNIHFFLGIQR